MAHNMLEFTYPQPCMMLGEMGMEKLAEKSSFGD